jgi:hypothetical protein
MKVEQAKNFQPITIFLESEYEIKSLAAILNCNSTQKQLDEASAFKEKLWCEFIDIGQV